MAKKISNPKQTDKLNNNQTDDLNNNETSNLNAKPELKTKHNKMPEFCITKKNKDENQSVGFKQIAKWSGLTLLSIICAFSFFLISAVAIAPQSVAQSFADVGLNKASYKLYKRIYSKEKTYESLYNVIQLAISNKNYEDIIYYSKSMLDGNQFLKFATEVDSATKKVLGEKYSEYANSYQNYLNSNLTIALYKNGRKNEAKMLAIESVYSSGVELFEYAKLLSQDDALSNSQRKKQFEVLHNRYGIYTELELKIEALNESISQLDAGLNKYELVNVLNNKLNILQTKYIICTGASTVCDSQNTLEEINNTKTKLKSLS